VRPHQSGQKPALSRIGRASEAEKIAALKLGYQINGNSMVKTDSSIDLTALTAPAVPHNYRRYNAPLVARERQAIGVK
jgi:hypothetical protein